MIQGEGFNMLVVSQAKQTMFFVCLKQESMTSWPRRQNFTPEDAEHEAEHLANVSVNEFLLFGEIWMKKEYGYLCSIEEGVFTHWSFGRMVLLGDAAHKVSSFNLYSDLSSFHTTDVSGWGSRGKLRN